MKRIAVSGQSILSPRIRKLLNSAAGFSNELMTPTFSRAEERRQPRRKLTAGAPENGAVFVAMRRSGPAGPQSRGAKMDAETKGVPPASNHDGALLSAALRAVRRLRGMSSRDTAAAMHMPLRTYQRFESGETRPNLDHIHRFARATRSDPHALVMAVAIGAPELAVHTADNHLVTILTVGLQTYNRTQGDKIADLDVRAIVSAVTAMFDRLADATAAQNEARAWIRTGQDALAKARPKPGR